MFQANLSENQKLLKIFNSWNQSSVSLGKIHEVQKQAGDGTGLDFGTNECSTSETCARSKLDKDKYKSINFVRASTVYEHDKPEPEVIQRVSYENKARHKALDYVEPTNIKYEKSWLKPKPTGTGHFNRFGSNWFWKKLTQNRQNALKGKPRQYFNSRPVQKRYRLKNEQRPKQHLVRSRTQHKLKG